MDPSTVSCTVACFCTPGDVKKKSYDNPRDAQPNKKIWIQLTILYSSIQILMCLHELYYTQNRNMCTYSSSREQVFALHFF